MICGRYTASAISSIAFNESAAVVDGNVCRVLSRLTGIANHIKSPILKDKLGWRLADQIVKADHGSYAGEVNQSLMELGATYCAPSGTGIHAQDPLKDFYLSTRIGKAIGTFLADSNNDSFAINTFVANAMTVKGNHHCSLCETSAMSDMLVNIVDDLQHKKILMTCNNISHSHDRNCTSLCSFMDIAAIAGHAHFPTPPPKKSKREEVLVVAVAKYQGKYASSKWLMVKRPDIGLLAGQWEFPSLIIWTSSSTSIEKESPKSKKKTVNGPIHVPMISLNQRKCAIYELIMGLIGKSQHNHDILEVIQDSIRQHASNVPINHVFSHVRHTMWIEHIDLSFMEKLPSLEIYSGSSSCRQETKWMTHVDMKNVGITSGVRKVIAATVNKF